MERSRGLLFVRLYPACVFGVSIVREYHFFVPTGGPNGTCISLLLFKARLALVACGGGFLDATLSPDDEVIPVWSFGLNMLHSI